MRKLQLSEDVFDIEYDIFEKNHYCDYDDSQYYFGELDNQDGRYYEKMRYNTSMLFDDGEDEYYLEIKKGNALLYLHLHQELIEIPKYKAAYDMLRNEMVRTTAYWMSHSFIEGEINEEDRKTTHLALDIQILMCGREVVETYKKDAQYIVDKIA